MQDKVWYQDYYAKNRERLNERKRQRYQDKKELYREYNKSRKHENPSLWLLNVARARAKKKQLDFNITIVDIVVPEFCPILGIKLQATDGKVSASSPTLDRVDSSRGYVKGNVAVISHRANQLKNDASIEILEKLIEYMKN